MKYKKLYSELGKLLYAVADIDGKISPQEKLELRKIIHEELIPMEKQTDEYGTSVAYYPEFEFEILEEEISDAETAFESFIDYVEMHHTGIDSRMKKVCISVAEKLAAAYYGTNKKEEMLIQKLKDTLNNI